MAEFKGFIIPDGFDENIDKIKEFANGNCPCHSEIANFVPYGYCYNNCDRGKCILSCINRTTLREYLATLETSQPFVVGTIINSHRKLEIMSSFKDGNELYYAVKRYYDSKCDGLYIISSKKLIHDMNQCKTELIAQNKLHKQTIDENQVKINAIEKLLDGKK